MAQNIISERWTWTQQDALTPYAQAGQFNSPLIYYGSATLQSKGCRKNANDSGTASEYKDAFAEADTVLIRRIRVWSPLQGLGLAGAFASDATPDFRLYAARTGAITGANIVIQTGIALGEWVDVNAELDAAVVEGSGPWRLAPHLPFPMSLDSSRLASSYIGSAFLKFQIQVDLAHTLPALRVDW